VENYTKQQAEQVISVQNAINQQEVKIMTNLTKEEKEAIVNLILRQEEVNIALKAQDGANLLAIAQKLQEKK